MENGLDPWVAVELKLDAPFLTCTAYYRGMPAGRAVFTIDAGRAELGDVVVYDRSVHGLKPARWLGLRRNYRRMGIGTHIMKAALDYLRRMGVREVYGELGGGNPDVQRAWYRALGFNVTRGQVSKYLE